MSEQSCAGNVIAAIATILWPGLGQLLQGRLWSAILFCIGCLVGYALWYLILPLIIALLLHLWAIIDAAKFVPRVALSR